MAEVADYLEKELEFIKTLDELNDLMWSWVDQGWLTEEEAAEIYNKQALMIDPYTHLGISEDMREYLSAFTSKRDLADRLQRLGLEESVVNDLYTGILSGQPEGALAMREATGRALTAQEEAQFARQDRAKDLTDALSYTYNNPLVTQQDLGQYREVLNQMSNDFLEGKSNQIFDQLSFINQKAQERSASEGQRAGALLEGAMTARPGAFARDEIPPIPEALPIAEEYIKGTKLGKGTKLRSFIEREIPGIYQKTRGAREEWWQELHPPEEETFEDEFDRLTAEAGKWARIAGSAPSSAIAGDTYYGPGGLAGIASGAYKSAQEKLAGLRPEDYAKPWEVQRPEVTEDPFKLALRKKDFRAKYYRKPGAGLVRSLTPAVRF